MIMLYKKGHKAIYSVLNNANKTKQLPVKTLFDLLDEMVSVVILYNIEI